MSAKSQLASLTLVLVAAACAASLAPGRAASAPLAAPAVSHPAHADTSRAYLHSSNLPGHGVAIEGFSPVSYFEGRAERGSSLFAVEHGGVTYHLTSARQVEKFTTNPGRYVPAFGGWCAFGMAIEDKFPVDPHSYKIVGDKLLLFLANDGIDARALWNDGDEDSLLESASAHWRSVQG